MENYQNVPMDDIIFEGRNKQYGAYELRQNIDRHSSIGLLVTLSLFVTIMLIYNADFFKSTEFTPIERIVDINTTEFLLPEPEVKPEPIKHTASPPPANTITNTEFNIVENTVETPAPAAQDELIKYTASTETHIDPSLTASANLPLENINSSGNTRGAEAPIVEKPADKFVIVSYTEKMPTYKGGKEAMMAFLRDNIRPFDSDREKQLVGKVTIRFYIDTDGSVRNPEVLKDNVGGRCAEAAISAINKMPKWNPGMQGDKAVRVYFTLPVTFDLSKFQ